MSVEEAQARGLISNDEAARMRGVPPRTYRSDADRDVGAESHPQRRLYRLLESSIDRPLEWELKPGREVGRRFRMDMGYPELRIGIELDGFGSHKTLASFKHDRERSNVLHAHGWCLLHFLASDLAKRPEYIVDTVNQTIDTRLSRFC